MPIEIWEETYVAYKQVWIPEAVARQRNITGEKKTIVYVVERTPHYPLLRRATKQEADRWRDDNKEP